MTATNGMAKRGIVALASLALTIACPMAASAGDVDAVNGKKTPLDEYIAKPDPTYGWKVVNKVSGDGFTTTVLDLKSQTWRAVPEVDRPLWQHWLVIVKPETVKHETAFLMIGGGRNGGNAPERASADTIRIALATNSVVAELKMIPNQTLIFNGDGRPRVEDDLIAYGWARFMETRDATWLPQLPMAKSAVRAMDAVTEFLASAEGGRAPIKKFVVAGGSKRGWTTWLTAAVDRRVAAIIPAVIDVVNVRACSINHFCAYGFWAPAIGDYTRHKIQDRMDTPEEADLYRIVDPYYYRDRLTMPKFVLNAAGDQYFPPDSSKFYFDQLPGPSYLRYVANADHSLRGSDAQESILAFYQSILNETPLPRFSSKVQPDASIRVEVQDKPTKVNVWRATNSKARDFRLVTVGRAYQDSVLEEESKGAFVAKTPKPEAGWTAFFVELVYENGGKPPYKFTSQVSIVPDVLPHRIEELKKPSK